MGEPIVVIGAGIGGLSAAIHLAAAGKRVIVLEQNEQVGGKMGEIRLSGYRWDSGPSLITMRYVFEDLFRAAGEKLENYLTLRPVDPLTRFFFPGGTVLDLSRDLPTMLEVLDRLNRRDVEGYLRFLAYAARLFRIVGPIFMFDQPPRLASLRRVSLLDVLRFDGLRTMNRAIDRQVHSPELRQALAMFATYVGASPFQAPATLNVIAHVELNEGLWYPVGGVYQIALAYANLAEALGVEIRTGQRATQIETRSGRAWAVRVNRVDGNPASERIQTDAVVANLDVGLVYRDLLSEAGLGGRWVQKTSASERSCSAFVMLLGVRGLHPHLSHHNTLFSVDYRREFHDIFAEEKPPDDPTVYISISSKTDPTDAPAGAENWFIQVNTAALSPKWDWSSRSEAYSDLILDLLAERGLDIRTQIDTCRVITPLDIAKWTGAWRGALYGGSSNSRLAAFRRPHNRSKAVGGLYFAGGTAHPGGGVPMVTLSGKTAASLLLQDLRTWHGDLI